MLGKRTDYVNKRLPSLDPKGQPTEEEKKKKRKQNKATTAAAAAAKHHVSSREAGLVSRLRQGAAGGLCCENHVAFYSHGARAGKDQNSV